MTRKQLLIELRRSFGFFAALILGRIVVVSIAALSNSAFIRDFIRPMCTLVAWVVILIYVVVDLYRELYFGKNKLILMIPYKSSFMWEMKYAAYSLYIIAFTLIGLFYEFFAEYGLFHLQIKESLNSFQGSAYYILSGMISSLCGLSLLFFSAAAGRISQNKGLSYLLTALVFFGIHIVWAVFILNITGALNGDCTWVIGILSGSEKKVYNQYAGMIPVAIIPQNQSFDISETISTSNLLSNIVALLFGMLMVHILPNITKHDYLEN